jgi:hypothetical protein
MEKIIQFVASLPSTSKMQGKLSDLLITNLWNVLLHPPLSYVADQYQYRSPDGSYNVPIRRLQTLIVEHPVSPARQGNDFLCQVCQARSNSIRRKA